MQHNLDYGVVGNCRSAALISKKGAIEWCCLPEFDSTSVFAKLLDKNKGGSFEILVDDDYCIEQRYIPRTNILRTSYKKDDNHFIVYDFMPRYKDDDGKHYTPPDLIRYFKHISGSPKFKIKYDPKLEYAQHETKFKITPKYIKSYTQQGIYDSVYLYTNLEKQRVMNGDTISLSESAFFLLSYNQKILEQNTDRINLKYERTKLYWLNWTERTLTYAKYNHEIFRSALVLKLLSYDKSGAILAAATTSLPETIGEERNWDYRFCWLRDASMVIKVMSELGHENVAKRYMRFIVDILPDKDEKPQIMYGINREKKLTERILHHLEGYQGSKPVRVGNAAYKQKQHDIYGILMDVIYQQFEIMHTSLENSEALWTVTRSFVKIVEKSWRKPDRGIWEIRSDQKHFTFSKVLCWVAVDRAIKIAKILGMKEYMEPWVRLRDKIHHDVIKNAWNEEKQAFTQFYGSTDLDASNLLMETYGFIEARDPKYISTVKQTEKELTRNGLMYRYKNQDDFGLPSSSFTICTFWLIMALYKTGNTKKAEQLFEQIIKYSNHVGLFSEDIDFDNKRLLGNFPQAYSHLALIETATLLAKGKVTSEEKIMDSLK